jgi:N-methylhydantoinase B
MNLPAEAMELEAPIRINRWCLKTDSGGPGTWRGGLGQIKEFEVLDDVEGTLSFSHRGERHFVPAPGMRGGGAGACARSWIERRDGSKEMIPSKVVTRLAPGDRLVIETAGAGGYGDPAGRSAQAVKTDLADGKVSAHAAGEKLAKT